MMDLIKKYKTDNRILNVNGHVHTPYSFSSFESIEQIFQMAKKENIDVVGINDFFTIDGYEAFYGNSRVYKKYPLFNIEFIGLIEEFQEEGIKINDPNNPGRIYFSGKGLKYPLDPDVEHFKFISKLIVESQKQVSQMTEKACSLLHKLNPRIDFTYQKVKDKYAMNLVRERHIAKAIKDKVFGLYKSDDARRSAFSILFGGADVKSSINNDTSLENEIRSRLLKSGGAAFVPETKESFPPLIQIIDFIISAGGIPCYPVLLDDKKGNIITDFESDWEAMSLYLTNLGINCIELIPSRNSITRLTEFVKFFRERGYAIALGSEHNTPGLFPLEVKIEGDHELSAYLKEVAYESSCIIAAHQYLVAEGGKGYTGKDKYEEFAELGNAIIKEFIG